jgi:hypothetical protein
MEFQKQKQPNSMSEITGFEITNADLEKIKKWDVVDDPFGFVEFVVSKWNKHYGKVKIKKTKEKMIVEFITGGYSDNETIISSFPSMFWTLYWELSQRGGRFVFEVRKIKNREV